MRESGKEGGGVRRLMEEGLIWLFIRGSLVRRKHLCFLMLWQGVVGGLVRRWIGLGGAWRQLSNTLSLYRLF